MIKKTLLILSSLFLIGCASLDNSNQASVASRMPKGLPYEGVIVVPHHQIPNKVSPSAKKMPLAKVGPRTIALLAPKAILPPKIPAKTTVTADDTKPRLSPIARLSKSKIPAPLAIVLPSKFQKQNLANGNSPSKTDTKPAQTLTQTPSFLPAATNVPNLVPQASVKPSQGSIIEKDITTQAGADLLLQFNKLNWTLTTTGDELKRSGFLERRTEKDRTTFLFRPANPGKVELAFERQDLTTGTKEEQKFHWTVGPKGLPGVSSSPLTGDTGPMDLARVLKDGDGLERSGDWDGALRLYLSNYRPEASELNDRLANIYLKKNNTGEAEKYWERNLNSPDGLMKVRALTGFSDLRLKNDQDSRVLNLPALWTASSQVPDETQFLRIFDRVQAMDQNGQALSWGDNYDKWYEKPNKKDWFLYLKAKILEKPSDKRNIRESLRLYNELVADHPFSKFWKEAGERVNFLNRNYFQVR